MYFKGHFQNAYVTRDLDAALDGIEYEFIWASAIGWEVQGWPKDRRVY
jgi:hypothetical protein